MSEVTVVRSSESPFDQPNNTISLSPLQKAVPSNVESRNSGGTAHILPEERKKATFEIEKLTNVFDGGPEKTKRRRFIISPSEGTDVSNKFHLNRHEAMKQHIHHFNQVHDEFMGKFVPTREDVVWMTEYTMMSGTLMNHYGLFLPTLMGQGSDDQTAQWLFKTAMLQIVGCYAQTELGHGSNVRGLQTTATYDPATQEFILNTPTLRSIKWWPGTLGKVCTHALVFAQLIIKGAEYGVHVFLVQIRDDKHRPLCGIEVGDLGPKMGDHANDTGFLRLDNIRIPRENMLSRYQSVTPEGEYIKSKKKTNDKIHYATMMFTRGSMVKQASAHLAKAVTIAMRYSCVREQGFSSPDSTSYRDPEKRIIDHQVQQYRIFKQLALCYAIKFSGLWMIERFKSLEEDKVGVLSETKDLPEVAATAAGLKALSTFLTAQGIEDCRKCCGGNGYLLSSGIAALSQDFVWQTTAEGDFIILILQTARFLIKCLKKVQKGTSQSGPCEYLNIVQSPNFNIQSNPLPRVTSYETFFNLDYLQNALRHRALLSVFNVHQSLSEYKPEEAWNNCSIELVDAVKAHCTYFMFNNFLSKAKGVEDPNVASVLTEVLRLYAVNEIIECSGFGFIMVDELKYARVALVKLLQILRPNGIALTDAFDIPDRVLNSTIGRYDGNVYEALIESVKSSQLNDTDPFVGYEEELRPRLDLDLLKIGNKLQSNL